MRRIRMTYMQYRKRDESKLRDDATPWAGSTPRSRGPAADWPASLRDERGLPLEDPPEDVHCRRIEHAMHNSDPESPYPVDRFGAASGFAPKPKLMEDLWTREVRGRPPDPSTWSESLRSPRSLAPDSPTPSAADNRVYRSDVTRSESPASRREKRELRTTSPASPRSASSPEREPGEVQPGDWKRGLRAKSPEVNKSLHGPNRRMAEATAAVERQRPLFSRRMAEATAAVERPRVPTFARSGSPQGLAYGSPTWAEAEALDQRWVDQSSLRAQRQALEARSKIDDGYTSSPHRHVFTPPRRQETGDLDQRSSHLERASQPPSRT